MALGIAQRMSEESRNFALNRIQFGRPITKFQGLQCMLADMSISLKPSHVVLNDAVHSAGDGFPDICAAAQAKMFASETAIKVTQYALKIHLLMGYPRDVPMERLTRDARMFTIAGGTAQILRTPVAGATLGIKSPQTRDGYANLHDKVAK